MNKTEQVIVGMLTENTGSHFLDSGGAYGRHWSRNQTRDFDAEPKVRAHFCSYLRESGERLLELQAHISLYHWMKENLEFDAEMQAQLESRLSEYCRLSRNSVPAKCRTGSRRCCRSWSG